MNPYKVLNIDKSATKQEIIRALTLAMRERKYSSREISVAQKKLMDPISKAVYEFMYFIDTKPLQNKFDLSLPDIEQVEPDIEYKFPDSR